MFGRRHRRPVAVGVDDRDVVAQSVGLEQCIPYRVHARRSGDRDRRGPGPGRQHNRIWLEREDALGSCLHSALDRDLQSPALPLEVRAGVRELAP